MSTPLERWLDESVIWRKEFHIVNKTYPMNTFKIRITDEPASIDKTANITILGSDIHPSVGLTVLLQKWKIPLPDFIISVIGSNQEVPINTKQMTAFAPGFANAVKSSNTWVIGGGTLHGVDKLITECVKSKYQSLLVLDLHSMFFYRYDWLLRLLTFLYDCSSWLFQKYLYLS